MIIDGKRASDRAIELILAYYAAFNRGDWEGLLALVTDNVAHEPNGYGHSPDGREVGRDALRHFLVRRQRSYREQLRNIIVTSAPDGHHAAAEYAIHGEYLADDEGLPIALGQRYELLGGAFFDLNGGRITRITSYCNPQKWISQIEQN